MIRFLAGDSFKNVFAVADDDQIIYQWAGASYRQILSFREHFAPELIQLVENRRCPPEVVQAANNLIKHNADRTPGKASLIATRPHVGAAIERRCLRRTAMRLQRLRERSLPRSQAIGVKRRFLEERETSLNLSLRHFTKTE
jgi:DNA helicase-2/ATP-dependent DNA helicase PcrA